MESRIASDLLVQAFGIDIFEATVNYYLDAPVNLQPRWNRAAAIAYLTAEREGGRWEKDGQEWEKFKR